LRPSYLDFFTENQAAKELGKGNEAIAEAAVRAGLEAYFGCPATPKKNGIKYPHKTVISNQLIKRPVSYRGGLGV